MLIGVISNDHERLSDTKHRAASLQQLSFLNIQVASTCNITIDYMHYNIGANDLLSVTKQCQSAMYIMGSRPAAALPSSLQFTNIVEQLGRFI